MAKEKVICDTDEIIDYWNSNNQRNTAAKNEIENIIRIDNVLISAVTKMELLSGATNKADLIRVNTNVNKFGIVLIIMKLRRLQYN